jgi:hypothetical protein
MEDARAGAKPRHSHAEQADTPELRAKLLNLAHEWMRAMMPDEHFAVRTGK